MPDVSVAGFSIVRNATLLDFPLEASVGSLLPGVDEFVLAVGRSDDDTLDRARAMAAREPKLRIIETVWDFSGGAMVLSQQTDLAMAACTAPWGIYIQADEVLADGGAEELRRQIGKWESSPTIEGLVVDYVHFYGSFDVVGVSRRWYRREVRAIRLDRDIHSFADAQGFRVGPEQRRVRCVRSGVTMFHYGWARPAGVLQTKRAQDRTIYPTEQRKNPARPMLPWGPGLRTFHGEHPVGVREWIAERKGSGSQVEPASFHRDHLRVWLSIAIERLTGWRPFEYRNYTLRS